MDAFTKIKQIISDFHPKNNNLTKALYGTTILFYLLARLFFFVLVAFLIWFGVYIFPYQTGKESGLKLIEAYEQSGCVNKERADWEVCVTVKDDTSEIISGLYLVQNETSIAVYNNKKTTVVKLPDQYSIIKQKIKITDTPVEN